MMIVGCDGKYYKVVATHLNIKIHSSVMSEIFPVSPIYSNIPEVRGGGGGLSPLGSSLPPDAASFSPLALGVKLSQSIPAYSYWNFQFEQSDPGGYIQFSFLIPRGSSIGKTRIGIKQTPHSS